MDLADFLLARIAEDEAVARAATPGPWLANGAMDQNSQVGTGTGVVGRTESFPGVDPRGDVVDAGVEGDGGAWYPDAVHIARNDPARVLAECEAKRRIVEMARESAQQLTETRQLVERLGQEPGPSMHEYVGWTDGLARAVTYLALPYADHPDYREEWKP